MQHSSQNLIISIVFSIVLLLTFYPPLARAEKLTIAESDKSIIFPSAVFKVSVKDAEAHEDGAWLAIYPASADDTEKGYISYQYLREHRNNMLQLKAPAQPGDYELRLFTEYSAKKSSVQLAFSVRPRNAGSIVLTLEPLASSFSPASMVKVTIAGAKALNPQAWLGIFPEQVKHGQHIGYTSYEHLNGEIEKTLRLPEQGGVYEVRLFDDTYGNQISQTTLRVTTFDRRNFRVSTSARTVGPSRPVEVTVFNNGDAPLSKNAWLGIYPYIKNQEPKIDKELLNYAYLQHGTNTPYVLYSPSEQGNYQVALFSSSNGEFITSTLMVVDGSLRAKDIQQTLIEEGSLSLYGVYFDHDKSDIKAASQPTLKALATALKNDVSLMIEIQGHTDATGSSSHNLALSQRRAEAVRYWLVTKGGITANRLKAKGYGDTAPAASNDSTRGRAENRRVEIIRR